MTSRPANPAPDAFRLIAGDGFSGAIGGIGQIIGAAGSKADGQDITIIRRPGRITFDPSFNAGGDVIRLPGNCGEWQVSLSGSSTVFLLAADSLKVVLPIGMTGTRVVLADGSRTLRYDDAAQAVMLGTQAVSAQAAVIATDGEASVALRKGGPPGQIFIQSGSTITISGNFEVSGRDDASDSLEITGGRIVLDPAFASPGNELRIHGDAGSFTAAQRGSNLHLTSDAIDLTIPIGPHANALVFDNAVGSSPDEDIRELTRDEAQGGVILGNQLIGTSPAALASLAPLPGKA